jgi:hypothetical protein
MSFTASREYPRAILRPLHLSPDVKAEPIHISQARSQPEISSSAWRSTTHIFAGTENREVNTVWPPTSFEHDPSAIPVDDKYNIPYDPKSTSCKQSLYHIYGQRQFGQTAEAGLVPTPSLVAKRYIPTDNAQNAGRSTGESITLLMLPGMGAPKEVRITRKPR